MSNPVEPVDEPFMNDALSSGDYSYANATPVTGHFDLPGAPASEPAEESVAEEVASAEPAGEVAEDVAVAAESPESVAPEELAEAVAEEPTEEALAEELESVLQADVPGVESDTGSEQAAEEMMQEAFSPQAPEVPGEFAGSPWADLSFLTMPGPMHEPSLEFAEATQPQPASAVSPTAGSSPDVHPTEMPQTPVSPGVAETQTSELQEDTNAVSPVNVEAPAPSAIETPPAPVAAPSAPVAGEPNLAAGELASGATVPDGAVGTAPIHPEPQAPAAVDMQMQMSENMADHFANVLHDVLQGKAP